jgi:hypothetical protein
MKMFNQEFIAMVLSQHGVEEANFNDVILACAGS